MYARLVVLIALATIAGRTLADEAPYRLNVGHDVRAGVLMVHPSVTGPPGAKLRYELVSDKRGGAGRSQTRQSGNVELDSQGTASLSTLRLRVGEEDRYEVVVRVFEGERRVAEDRLRYPP